MKRTNQHPRHQSRGLYSPTATLTDGRSVISPRCPLSGLLIAPGGGVHLVLQALDKRGHANGRAQSIYVARTATGPALQEAVARQPEFQGWRVFDLGGAELATRAQAVD